MCSRRGLGPHGAPRGSGVKIQFTTTDLVPRPTRGLLAEALRRSVSSLTRLSWDNSYWLARALTYP